MNSLWTRVQRSAQEQADRIALVDREIQLTYRELIDRIEAVSQLFATRIGSKRDPIAIIGQNGIEYVSSWWAARRLGIPVAELNPLEPIEKNLQVLASLDPSLIVTSLDPLSFGPWLPRVVGFERIATARPDASQLIPASSDSELAAIVFTSGTTGAPKGVMLTEANLIAVCEAILEYLPLRADDRYALVLPLFHTYAKSVMLTTLLRGGALCFEHDFNDLTGFVARLSQQRITAFSGVPYHINMLLRRAPLDARDLSTLRWVTISGSHCRHAALLELQSRLPDAQVIFMYGMTETSTRATALPPARLAEKAGSCGAPIRGVELQVRNDRGMPISAGEVGNLFIRGPNIMAGYWNDAGLTQSVLQDGWLRTGDIAHLDAEGFLYLHGRADDLIKSAGERVSAIEIEELLASHPSVVEVAVAGVEHPVLGEAVQAWIVSRHPDLDRNELLSYCARHLTPHKIPRAFVFCSTLPKTASGKIQKHRLLGGGVNS
jgi:acyl-CoA synthetase (AMP-forming)/AMP-acid ligase II